MPLPGLDPFTGAALLYGGGAAANAIGTALGKSGKVKQYPTMSPQQIQNANFAGQQGINQIKNPYQGFEPIANNARRGFYGQGINTLAHRFGAQGAGVRSSAFRGALGSAAGDLESQLGALQSQYGLQNQQLGQNLLNIGQRPQFENIYQPGGHTFLSSLFGGAGQALGGLGNVQALSGLMDRQKVASPVTINNAPQGQPVQQMGNQQFSPWQPSARQDVESLLDPQLRPQNPNQGQQNFNNYLANQGQQGPYNASAALTQGAFNQSPFNASNALLGGRSAPADYYDKPAYNPYGDATFNPLNPYGLITRLQQALSQERGNNRWGNLGAQ